MEQGRKHVCFFHGLLVWFFVYLCSYTNINLNTQINKNKSPPNHTINKKYKQMMHKYQPWIILWFCGYSHQNLNSFIYFIKNLQREKNFKNSSKQSFESCSKWLKTKNSNNYILISYNTKNLPLIFNVMKRYDLPCLFS